MDRNALEALVREVVERLLAQHPELFTDSPPAHKPTIDANVLDHPGRLLSEGDLAPCRKLGIRRIRVRAKTVITPQARDRAKDLGIVVEILPER